MNTYNLFPQLFSFGLIAPFILRLVLGLIFVNLGYLKLGIEKPRWITSLEILKIKPAGLFVVVFGIIEIVGGLLLLAGAYTQLVALVFAVISISELFIEYREETVIQRNIVFYLLISAICISLLLTGAGIWAVDLPMM